MSFNDVLKYLDSDAEEDLCKVNVDNVIPSKEEATFSLFRSILLFFDYILSLSFLRKNKSK